MKYVFIFLAMIGTIGAAYYNAQSKIGHTQDLKALHLGMTVTELEDSFGAPSAQNRNQLIYIFDDSSEMVVSLRDDVVASATIKYHQQVKITDPEMKKLTLVQMESESLLSGEPTWFFAGKPSEGLIYKITAAGVIESLTWVPPFSYNQNQPKQLQALLRDFQTQHLNL